MFVCSLFCHEIILRIQQAGRFEYVILTGNLCTRDVYDYFRSFTSYVYAVQGEYDDVCSSLLCCLYCNITLLLVQYNFILVYYLLLFAYSSQAKKYPETQTIKIEDFTIGLCHGHQVVPWGDKDALAAVQRNLAADILISGHTHKFAAYEVRES